MAFPLSSPPAGYATVTASERNGIYTVGMTPSFQLSQAGAEEYVVRNLDGDVVSSGAVTGTSFEPAAPDGGWLPGWYRGYLTVAAFDSTYGYSAGAFTFIVVRDTEGFPANPASDYRFPEPGYDEWSDLYAGTAGGYGNETRNVIMKGVLGIGPSRLLIGSLDTIDANDPLEYGNPDPPLASQWDALAMNTFSVSDHVRDRPLLANSPRRSTDYAQWLRTDTAGWITAYAKTPELNRGNIWIAAEDGTDAGTIKLIVMYPDSATVVEVYDNLAKNDQTTASATVNASSSYLKTFPGIIPGGTAATLSPTNLASTYRDGIVTWVEMMYPFGVTRFEGPVNEPDLGLQGAEVAHAMRLFQGAVHDGHADAFAVGPTPVDILDLEGWDLFLAAGGGEYCDEIAFHAYGTCAAGDLNSGRWSIERFLDLLADYGLQDKALWQTESTHAFTSVYGVYHPRRSNLPIMQTLLFEQYGVPRERNHVWYDRSHGFWSYPAWLETADGGLVPYACLYRVLAEETFAMLHHHRIDFGDVVANKMFLGSYYQSPRGNGVVVVQSASYIPGSSVTFSITGAADGDQLVCVSSQGVESLVAVAGGKVTVEVSEFGSYLRLPLGVYASVDHVLDFDGIDPSVSTQGVGRLGGAVTPGVSDGSFMTIYPSLGIHYSTASAPDACEVLFASELEVSGVVAFAGAAWQLMAVPTEATVDVYSGGSWSTVETLEIEEPSSFLHGTDGTNAGCSRETFWKRQWIFPVKFSAPQTCEGVRIQVTGLSYGGEPDAACVAAGGQGMASPKLAMQELAVLSPSTFGGLGYSDTVLSDGPVGYWRMGESSGTAAVSQVNNGTLQGTYRNTPSLGVSGALVSSGDTDTAATFSWSSASDMRVTSTALLDVANTFTIEAWVKRTAISNPSYEVIYYRGNVVGTPQLLISPSNLIEAYVYGNGRFAQSSVAITDTNWHHVALTRSGSTINLYLDGTDVTGSTSNFTCVSSTVDAFWGPLDGSLDECAFYDTYLPAGRIAEHYRAGADSSALSVVSAPVVEGQALYPGQIQVYGGEWSSRPTSIRYQWQSSAGGAWSDVDGATESSYVFFDSDVGLLFRCSVVASVSAGESAAVLSGQIGPVGLFSTLPQPSGVVLSSGVKSTTSDASNNITDVDKGWSIY